MYFGSDQMLLRDIFNLILEDGKVLLFSLFFMIILVLTIVFRSLGKTLLTILPMGLGLFVFVGLLGILKIPLNMFNVVVFPTLIGVALDTNIHITFSFYEYPQGVTFMRKVNLPIMVSTLTTAVAFASLMMCESILLHSIGLVAVVGFGSCYFVSIIIYPLILLALKRSRFLFKAAEEEF